MTTPPLRPGSESLRRRLPIRRYRSWPLAYAATAPMLLLSAAVGNRSLIFPEAAALSFGVLSLRLEHWRRSALQLALVPPSFACAGVAIAHAGLARWVATVIAISAAAAGLQLLGSRLTPSLSAGVFPVVFGVRSWSFPLAVLVICALLAAFVAGSRDRNRAPADPSASRPPPAALAAGWAVAVLWTIVAWPLLGLGAAAVAPPLIVAMIERVSSADTSALTGLRLWMVLVLAAAEGAVANRYVAGAAGGLLAIAAVLVTFAVVGRPHPPALAICLIPQVAGSAFDAAAFVANVAIGSAALYAGAAVLTRLARTRYGGVIVRGSGAAPSGSGDLDLREQPDFG